MKSRKKLQHILFIFFLSLAIFGIMALDSDNWAWATVITYVGMFGSYIFGKEIGATK